jgi:hypothetical protein
MSAATLTAPTATVGGVREHAAAAAARCTDSALAGEYAAFVATGEITAWLFACAELTASMWGVDWQTDPPAGPFEAFCAYVLAAGTRGPIAGWTT